MVDSQIVIRAARASDVRRIREVTAPYVDSRAIVPKPAVSYYESLQEFVVAEIDEVIVGCGALHVMWENVAEIRTLAVDRSAKGRGVGSLLVDELLTRAKDLGVARVFCLTFETDFFARHGFVEIDGAPVEPTVFAELLQSYDEGVAEFLDLDRVKPNTLGNTRMLLTF
ncbi:amino-acid N-acetyltransferase [Yimella sp. cx-51]|uniref:amino-acid N-acetyltransferase n=1 Tax=Yimella sp. cx-51 TaxID=2770551 RepID=UPI00165E170F|nr:amino-acid N-acetyltransferase [Yimella sp. cx-51]MBC9956372.1 amino-acid N-acetyltransferase [Yimella sp. cx-51]MBD2759817.1 amino-acid N-acetyltransferase [Yimella sp. cx-573]QTH38508.1 amino-acid N-acetyltransferase [Yimella sp. cx-51]